MVTSFKLNYNLRTSGILLLSISASIGCAPTYIWVLSKLLFIRLRECTDLLQNIFVIFSTNNNLFFTNANFRDALKKSVFLLNMISNFSYKF